MPDGFVSLYCVFVYLCVSVVSQMLYGVDESKWLSKMYDLIGSSIEIHIKHS